MVYSAKVIEVMIASPSDVTAERQIVREEVADWNVLHARERETVLLPTGWETHISPDLVGRPQQVINDRLLSKSDILIGIFWTRIGTATGKYDSGTVEEIKEHHAAGKPVMLYFSNAPVPPDKMDAGQYAKVEELKAWAFKEGPVGCYGNLDEFKSKLQRDLHLTFRDNAYLKSHTDVDLVAVFEEGLSDTKPKIGEDALTLLRAAAANTVHSHIIVRSHGGGTDILGGGQAFGDPTNPREVARWRAIVDDIYNIGFVRDVNGKGQVFELNDAAYRFLETNS